MTGELSEIIRRQRAWAQGRDLGLDASGRVAETEANLFEPIDPETTAILAPALGDRAKPDELRRLESTAALACSALARRDAFAKALAAAGGFPAAAAARLASAPRPALHGESGGPAPAVDFLLEPDPAHGRPILVLASFAEPYRDAPPHRAPANRPPASFLEADPLWQGLPGTRALARDLRFAPARYQHVDTTRLLARVVALTGRLGPRGFRVVHLWYDASGPMAAAHRSELDRLRFRVGGEVDLRVVSWQRLFAALGQCTGSDARYVGYLRDRYARRF